MSRLISVQTFYQYDFFERKTAPNTLASQLTSDYFLTEEKKISCEKKIDAEFLETLISGLVIVLDKVDEEIAKFLKGEWTIKNLPDVALQILRLGTFELKYMKDTPTNVIISEYVDITASFYDEKQITFVNSILQNIANSNRKKD